MSSRTAVVLIAFLSIGCVETEIPTVDEQLLTMQITVSPPSIGRGQSATITVTVTNPFDFDAQLAFPTSCQARAYVRTAQGQYVTPPMGQYTTCANVQTFLVLQPQESRTYTFLWSGESQFGPPGSGTELPRGNYYASADLLADGYTGVAFPVIVTLN